MTWEQLSLAHRARGADLLGLGDSEGEGAHGEGLSSLLWDGETSLSLAGWSSPCPLQPACQVILQIKHQGGLGGPTPR